MFQNLTVIKVTPVAGKDRNDFALAYLAQCVDESLISAGGMMGNVSITHLNVPCGEGDIRPLVRYLRMLSFYIHALAIGSKCSTDTSASSNDTRPSIAVSVYFDGSTNITTIKAKNNSIDTAEQPSSLQLKPGSFQNLYYVTPSTAMDQRASQTVAELQTLHPQLRNPDELSQILDFYFCQTLAPAVVLSHDSALIRDLVTILSSMDHVKGIAGIDPTNYKMMKSLYDENGTPNLRDDIIQILHEHKGDSQLFVAIEIKCSTSDAQLQIREIIEDTPSRTAFSTEQSALHKGGLLFGVYIQEGVITPEIQSRASLII